VPLGKNGDKLGEKSERTWRKEGANLAENVFFFTSRPSFLLI